MKDLDTFIPEVQQHIASRFGNRRKELKITQREVALTVGLTNLQIIKYEQGKSKIPSDKLYIIAHLFDVDINYFYDGLLETKENKEAVKKIKFANPHKKDLIKKDLIKNFSNIDADAMDQHIEKFLLDVMDESDI